MQKIILVGNGSSLLNKENGENIDAFEKVVRFNAYTIKTFEKHVGTKTSIWFNVINFSNKEKEWRMKVPYEKIVVHSWEWSNEKDKLYKEFLEYYKHTNIPVSKTTRNLCVELQEFLGSKDYFVFSTGLLAIWLLLKEYETLTITGFDWWSETKHHYNDNAPRGNNHKPLIEKMVIDKLVNDKKVIFL